jgi:hypothetical protein
MALFLEHKGSDLLVTPSFTSIVDVVYSNLGGEIE